MGSEIEEMKLESNNKLSSEESTGLLKLFTDRSLRMPLIISVMMHLSQQLSGINAVCMHVHGFSVH